MEKTPDHTGRVPTRKRRARYILVACLECRRRKIKCSGGQPCESCAFHEITCSYPQEGDGEPSKKESSSTTKKRREPGHMRVERPARPRAPSRADAELQERLRRLEEEVFQRTSYPPSHISLDQSPTAVIDEGIRMRQNEKNQFCACGRAIAESDLQDYEDVDTPDDESQGRTTAYISLAMQIRTLKEAVPEPVWSDGHSALPQTDVETCLISNDRLYYLLDLFFSEFNCYIVAIDCSDFMTRLESLFQESSVSQSQQLSIQNAKPEQITLIALACMILAKAELLSVEPRTESQFYRSHQSWYAESCRVMARYYQTRPSNFDLVQLRLVESFYMIALERVDRFSSAVMNAVNEAFAAGLNDQSLWKNCSKTEITSRCALWWTMYLMDRQAAQRYGRSYLIRDTDFSVQDFTAECKQPLSVDGEVPIPFLHYPGLKIRLENQEYSSPQTTSSGYLSEYEWYHYLQFIATIGRLVTRACDSFYCYCAPKKGDYEETESIDALLLRARRNLCPSLLWYTGNSMPDVNMPTVSAQIMRLRIISFLRVNILRLSIRRHLWKDRKDESIEVSSSDREFVYSVRLCHDIAIETIQAITEYITNWPSPTFSSFSTMSLIECIYNLIALPKVANMGSENHCESVTTAVKNAVRCIQTLAQLHQKFAQNADKVLRGFLQPGICVLHRSNERHNGLCTLPLTGSDNLIGFNDYNLADANAFHLSNDSFRFAAPGSHISLDIEDVMSSLDQDMFEWPRTVLA